MPQWEYLAAQVEKEPSGAETIRYVNGEELPDWQTTQFHIFLSQAGVQGWELVGETLGGSFLVFKRAVVQQAPSWSAPPAQQAGPRYGSPFGVM